MVSQSILFVQAPNKTSSLLQSSTIVNNYNIIDYKLTSKDDFLEFLKDNKEKNITAIHAGFPAFHPIGGLTDDIISNEHFRNSIRCVTLCSRGVNFVDLVSMKRNGIQLYNYQDTHMEPGLDGFKKDLVGNDVADCAMWHVLEGFRKFSLQMGQVRSTGDTIKARANVAGLTKDTMRFAFGHELVAGKFIESPRGKKCLILGLGSIGTQIGVKLQYGLGMEVHYSKRSEDMEVSKAHGWGFHRIDSILKDLDQFHAIVIALPGTAETHRLVNQTFLDHCIAEGLVLVNIGRASILDMGAVEGAIKTGKIRHLGVDVFSNEPTVDPIFLNDHYSTTATPHIGSGTVDVFEQSCELALMNIIKATNQDKTLQEAQLESFSRVL